MVFKKIAVLWGIFIPRTGIDVCHEICSAFQIAWQTAELLKSVSFQWPMPLSYLSPCQAKGRSGEVVAHPAHGMCKDWYSHYFPAIAVNSTHFLHILLTPPHQYYGWLERERDGRMSGGVFPFVYQWDVLFSASNTSMSLLFFPAYPLLGFHLYFHRKSWIVLKEIHLYYISSLAWLVYS